MEALPEENCIYVLKERYERVFRAALLIIMGKKIVTIKICLEECMHKIWHFQITKDDEELKRMQLYTYHTNIYRSENYQVAERHTLFYNLYKV